jgi:hypothetical protein
VLHYARLVILGILVGVVITATTVALAESYAGLREWAIEHDLAGWRADAWPLQVDTFIVAGEATLFMSITDRAHWRTKVFGWALTLGGLGASIAANVGRVQPPSGSSEVLVSSQLTAAVPPIAAAVGMMAALGVLKMVLANRPVAEPAEDTAPAQAPVPAQVPAPTTPPARPDVQVKRPAPAAPRPVAAAATPSTVSAKVTPEAVVKAAPKSTPAGRDWSSHPRWNEAVELAKGQKHTTRSLADALGMANRLLPAAAIKHVQGGTA